jgi:hypothetical protein
MQLRYPKKGKIAMLACNQARTRHGGRCGQTCSSMCAERNVLAKFITGRDQPRTNQKENGKENKNQNQNKKQNRKTKRKYRPRVKPNSIDLYVIRLNDKDEIDSSRPCNLCLLAMRIAGVRKVIYSNSDGTYTIQRVRDMESTHFTRAQLLHGNEKINRYHF